MKVEGGYEVPADGDPGVVCDDLVAYRLDRLGVRLHPAHLDNTEHGYTHPLVWLQPDPTLYPGTLQGQTDTEDIRCNK